MGPTNGCTQVWSPPAERPEGCELRSGRSCSFWAPTMILNERCGTACATMTDKSDAHQRDRVG